MSEFTDYLEELFAAFGPVRFRRMFGGYGIYRDDLMFALVAEDTLYFKADAESEPQFRRRGLAQFEYRRRDKTIYLSYFQAPAQALDDASEMARWAELAWGAARRAAQANKRLPRRRSRGAARG